jgi:hypothetical protein
MNWRTRCTVIALCVVSRAALAQTSGSPTVNQGLPAGGGNGWPVTVTEDTTNTKVKPGDAANKAVRVNCVTGCSGGGGGGGASKTDDSAFGIGTDAVAPAGGLADEVSPDSVDEGDTGLVRMSLNRNWYFQLRDGLGNERGASVTAANALKIDGSAVTQPVSGTVAVTQSGGWSVTANAGTNLNTSALVLESTFGRAQGSATSGQTGPLIQGAVTTAAPSYTTAQTSPLSLTLSGSLRVDGSGATQPVSGTVTANQGGTWTVQPGNTANTTPWVFKGNKTWFSSTPSTDAIAAGVAISEVSPTTAGTGAIASLSLDANTGLLRISGGYDHDAAAVSVGVEPLLIGGYASAAAPTNVSADGDAVRAWFRLNGAQVVNESFGGTFASTGTGAADGGTKRVAVASDSTITPRTVSSANNTGTCTSVGTSSTTVLASNASRKAYGFKAPSTNSVVVFCKLGATATTSAVPFEAGSSWSQDNGAVYTGVIDCITASSTSSICVYEFN